MTKSETSKATSNDIIKVAGLKSSGKTEFLLKPDSAANKNLAADLKVLGVSKLRFAGYIRPMGKSDWVLHGKLGASVQQTCVITLESVTSRINADVSRLFTSDMPDFGNEEEREMVEDENIEPLTDVINLADVMAEALALNLPAYPKKDGAEIEKTDFAASDVEPLNDETIKPFAGLAALRDKLNK